MFLYMLAQTVNGKLIMRIKILEDLLERHIDPFIYAYMMFSCTKVVNNHAFHKKF